MKEIEPFLRSWQSISSSSSSWSSAKLDAIISQNQPKTGQPCFFTTKTEPASYSSGGDTECCYNQKETEPAFYSSGDIKCYDQKETKLPSYSSGDTRCHYNPKETEPASYSSGGDTECYTKIETNVSYSGGDTGCYTQKEAEASYSGEDTGYYTRNETETTFYSGEDIGCYTQKEIGISYRSEDIEEGSSDQLSSSSPESEITILDFLEPCDEFENFILQKHPYVEIHDWEAL
nr:dehydration responsive element-binding protein A6 [Ipomoea batatas]